ncbi:MAG: tRNA preQ1(34) S-adenosylmethionine ribosyltransferase-isomerase QueA [Fuerstiella sp.]|nr:tRNA preQ1(34) S-adenosylmethionine ribosyltransferase-isomerase QueA [Fuerstiella sp.]
MTADLNHISAWKYSLPQDLIAVRPAQNRDDARLMVIDRASGSIEHHTIRDLPELLPSGDRLIFNNTKVIPARLFGYRTATNGRWEGLYLNESHDGLWRITGQTRGKLQPGENLTIHPPDRSTPELCLTLEEQLEDGSWTVRPDLQRDPLELLSQFGSLPLPPYIGRSVADENDQNRYQTVFGDRPGAIAAPTAGLHFTESLLDSITDRGIHRSQVTLHVGIGTFRPVSTEQLSEHKMHSEWCEVSEHTATDISETKARGSRIIAVGTTCVRTLESAAASGTPTAFRGSTNLFIRTGFRFQVVDQLLTNFHLPGSTLIVLVGAFAGHELTMQAYHMAVEKRYRFYSYGDAMLIR